MSISMFYVGLLYFNLILPIHFHQLIIVITSRLLPEAIINLGIKDVIIAG